MTVPTGNKNSDAPTMSALQNEESRKLLDVVDQLRSCHVGDIVDLPQLVVCGDQSSGKSSVLEGLTQVPFPCKDTLCTRFATEIILRCSETDSIRAKIIPDISASASEVARLNKFGEATADFGKLDSVFAAATKYMGLTDLETDKAHRAQKQLNAFSKHVLRIEISGPKHPTLTLVDLPGYVHSTTRKHTEADVKYIQQMISNYMSEERTVILAVITATTEYANQVILKMAREADPKGTRTLGIITKLDMVKEPGRHEEILHLARNMECENKFKLGWHVVRNRGCDEPASDFQARNNCERKFFEQPKYNVLKPNCKGIDSLSERLSKIVYEQLKRELPKVQSEVDEKLQDKETRLQQLGEQLESPKEQRERLFTLSQKYATFVSDGLEGVYKNDDFFMPQSAADTQDGVTNARLRTSIRSYEDEFAMHMRCYGHFFHFPQMEDAVPCALYEGSLPHNNTKNSREAIDWVASQVASSRGRELPGSYNPLLISQLFWVQSKEWPSHGKEYIDKVDNLVSCFVESVVKHITNGNGNESLQKYIDKTLDQRLNNAKKELAKIIKVHKLPVNTSDPYFIRKVEKLRIARVNRVVSGKVIDLTQGYVASDNAMDAFLIYYGGAVEFFITAVLKQVMEQYMLEGLAEETLSPIKVSKMTEDEVKEIMAEDDNVAKQRQSLKVQISKLKQAQITLQGIAPSHKRPAETEGDGSRPSKLSNRAARRGLQ